MPTVRERILAYLGEHPEGVDDDALAAALGLSRRQHANQECRRLEQQGLVVRRPVGGKIRNFLAGRGAPKAGPSASTQPSAARTQSPAAVTGERPWHWEGSVQSRVVTYLADGAIA